MLVFGSVNAVYGIIAAHHRPWFCLQRDLERAAIRFAQSSLVHFAALEKTIVFAIVCGKMFQRRAYPLALNAFDISGCKFSRKNSVLGKVFEISSAKGRAFQIHARAENDRDVLFYAIFRDSLPYGVYKRLVE